MEKLFILRCKKCLKAERSTGLSSDLKHLKEIISCPTCGKKHRTFRCNECGGTMILIRVKNNSST